MILPVCVCVCVCVCVRPTRNNAYVGARVLKAKANGITTETVGSSVRHSRVPLGCLSVVQKHQHRREDNLNHLDARNLTIRSKRGEWESTIDHRKI